MPFRYPIFARRRALNVSPVTYRRAIRGTFEARIASQATCSILAASWTNVIKILGQCLQARGDEHGREIATEEAEKRTCSRATSRTGTSFSREVDDVSGMVRWSSRIEV